ncbi:MAG: His/Gly/Thr/Pro-type tRNA ligase C-terminal domain-containing protein, partial [Planctomycetota bacterium]|nr:His/Gly/Thr/Pro-type tRNA ligase C-terminal domain-containing protein [Planctomycetota bacterium]
DDSDDRIQAKIRVAAQMKIPYLLVVGPNDQQRNEVSVRARGIRRDLGPLVLETFVRTIKEEIETRGRRTVVSEHFQATAV